MLTDDTTPEMPVSSMPPSTPVAGKLSRRGNPLKEGRAAKRRRGDNDLIYENAFMADSNPLSRKSQKSQNKRDRKNANRWAKVNLEDEEHD